MMTLQQVSQVTGLKPGTLRQRIARGILPAKKKGRDWQIYEVQVKKLLKGKKS